MVPSLSEEAKAVAREGVYRIVATVTADEELRERLVEDIAEDLDAFEVRGSDSPLFRRLIEANLRKRGCAVGPDEGPDGDQEQMLLFPPAGPPAHWEDDSATRPARKASPEAAARLDDEDGSDGPCEDIPREDIPREDIPREDIPREGMPREGIPREDMPREDIPREDMPREDIPRQADDERLPSSRKKRLPRWAFPPDLSPNAVTVLEKRYLRKDETGRSLETPAELFLRVARDIAQAEKAYGGKSRVETYARRFYEMIARLEFMPNSPTLMNAGRELQQLSACFVLPVDDSMESIFGAVRDTALIHKSGGGTGFSFSRLRPKNDVVASTQGVSSGPVSFMKVFDQATESVKQGGTRRGANMAVLRVDHPDVLEFIDCKKDLDALNNFNVSVGLTEDFMKAVAADAEYELVNPRNGEVAGRLEARKVFERIIDRAWLNGEPGILFLDRINATNPTPHVGAVESTNPCGEQPLLPYESCNLGSINLARMVREGEGGRMEPDFEKLGETVDLAVRFLDDVIDRNHYPLEDIGRVTRSNRKIGLGVMGFADMLLKMEVPYDSDEALHVAEEVMSFVDARSHEASRELARERGAFPNFEGSRWAEDGGHEIRHATTTTIAPTGSISIIANCSSGVEPLFALSFVRRVLDGTEMLEVNPLFEEVALRDGFFDEDLMMSVADKGTVRGFEAVPADVRRVFATAHDISPDWHVKMQAAFQRHVDNAVSKTVNFPSSATRDDIRRVYELAYELGCKGVTVYRDGSRKLQVLSTKGEATGETEREKGAVRSGFELDEDGEINPQGMRPDALYGFTRKIRTSEGKFYLTVNEHEGRPFEVFSTPNSRGREAAINAEALCRLVSLALRHDISVQFIHDQLQKVRNQSLLSLPYNIARVLERYLGEGPGEQDAAVRSPATRSISCPECGSMIQHDGGCFVCRACGYSKCE